MLDISFVSDYVCPFCLVAKEALEQAVLALKLRKDVKITYYPYELTPPDQPQKDTFHDPEHRSYIARLEAPAEELGLRMQLPPDVSPRPRTRLAFEAWLYACDHDRGSLWNASMYHAYFVDELDIGDRGVLLHIAKSLLLNTDDLSAAWDEGRYTQRLLDLEQEARERFQPRTVPTIYCNGRYMKVREFTKDELVQRLMEAMEAEHRRQAVEAPSAEPETGASCGIDGCK